MDTLEAELRVLQQVSNLKELEELVQKLEAEKEELELK